MALITRRLATLLAGLALLGLAGDPGHSSPVGTVVCGWRSGHPPRTYAHVITIVMENKSYSEIDGSSRYLNDLAHRCGLATNYWAITHPSLPNYIALTSGDPHGLADNCTECSTSATSIFQQTGLTGWRAYEETMPQVGYLGSRLGPYTKTHNPAAYFRNIREAYQHDAVPLGRLNSGQLANDLRRNQLRAYSLIVPNKCHDEHDCPVKVGDAWLMGWVEKIIRSTAYLRGKTALFITYDEGSDSDNQVYTLVLNPYTKPGTTSNARLSHYSLLRAEENMLGLPCLAHACDATSGSMRAAFGF